MIITSFLLFSSSFLSILADNSRPKYIDDGMCTALGIGRLATSDQSTITTHNADCQECDIRVTHVPARDWPSNSKRPVFRERLAYPRLLETEENNIHGPEYLVGTIDTTIYPWEPQEPIFYVDQVEHTYAYTMGHYPLQNEKQLTMGESTCYTTFWSIPSYFPDGKANFNLRSLMEIAMERCETARCAITTMGDYAVKYGFYAIDGSGPKADSGESLSIGDKKEMWIFHINADDTHESAVWVAQRVPDDEIAVIANQYIIGEIDLSNPDYFMASSNIYDVAIRSGLWSPDSGIPFNFLHIYGLSQAGESHGMNLRVWRAMTLAAPSKSYLFNPLTDYYATFGYGPNFTEPYPFSIKPDHPLTLQEIMAIARDNYENTAFDLTENPLGGPFGDVIQTGGSSLREDPEHGLTSAELKSSAFPTRAISIWRTTYSSIAQSRESLPDEIGALTWIAQYAPHHSSYTPVYVSPHTVPSSITNTTQYKFDKTKNYWIHLLTGNYVSRWYIWTIGDVRTFQKEIEADIFHKISIIESKALKQIEAGNVAAAINLLSEFQEKTANQIVEKWWDFFHFMVSKYRDIVRVDNFHAENFAEAITWINYRRWWMELVGFWGPPGTPPQGKLTPEGVSPIAFNTQASPAEYQKVYPQGSSTKYYLHATTSPNDQVNVAPEPPVSNPIQVPVPVPSNNDIITDTPVTTEPPVVIIPDSTEAPQNQSDNDNNNNNPSTTTTTGSHSSTTTGVIGFFLGFICKALYDYIWNQYVSKRSTYSRIADSDIQI